MADKPSVSWRGERLLMLGDHVEVQGVQGFAGRSRWLPHRARWGNPPRGVRAAQAHSVDSMVTSRTAPPPARVRLSFVEPVTAADENAGAEGRVQLVARERYVVDAAFLQVDATVGSQLSSVDEDTCAATVSDVSQTCNRQDLTGHVGGPGDCEQRGRLGAQFTDQTLDRFFDGVCGG